MCSAQTLTMPPSLCCPLLESLPASPSLSDSLGSASSPATLRPQQAPSLAHLAWLSPPGAVASLPAAIPHPCATNASCSAAGGLCVVLLPCYQRCLGQGEDHSPSTSCTQSPGCTQVRRVGSISALGTVMAETPCEGWEGKCQKVTQEHNSPCQKGEPGRDRCHSQVAPAPGPGVPLQLLRAEGEMGWARPSSQHSGSPGFSVHDRE